MNILSKRYFPYQLKESADIRVFAFPFAGAGVTAFDRFLPSVPEWMDFQPVRLPGRENRISELVITDVRKLAKVLAHAIQFCLDKPFAFLGICYGGLLAYELTLELYRQTERLPQVMFFLASPAPSCLPRSRKIHHLPDPEMIEALRSLEGMPSETLDNTELLPIILPAVRGDFTAIETYRSDTIPEVISVPFILLGGREDSAVTPNELEAWRSLTNCPTQSYYYDGGHFFYNDCSEVIMDVFKTSLLTAQR